MFGYGVEPAPCEVAEGVAAKDVSGEKDDINYQNDGSDADAEVAIKVEGYNGIPHKKGPDDIGEAKEVAMEVLEDQGKAALAEVFLARLANGTGRRVGPEGFVVRAAIVIAGEAEETRDPENEEGRRKRQEARIPVRLGSEEGA